MLKRRGLAPEIFLIIFLTSCHANQKVVLFLLDGFRHDYPFQNKSGFKTIISNGVTAGSFKPVFPSLSFTNYYSIATGLQPESHGIIHNYIYDPTEDREFLIGSQECDFDAFWWKDGEPIWISAEKQRKKAVMYYWPGCEAQIQKLLPTKCVKYRSPPTIEELSSAINESMKELAGGAEFAAIYYEYIDKHGHRHGPGSDAVITDITEIGKQIQRMLETMETTNMVDGSGMLSSVTNVIIVSDHGMASSAENQRIILENLIDKNNLKRALPPNSADTVVQLWPKEGHLESIYLALQNVDGLTAYKKSELLDRWHFKHNDRVPPITVVADNHYSLLSPTYENDPLSYGWSMGMHGYDNALPEMGGVFLAAGPSFKSGIAIGELRSVDLYQIMCAILEVPAAPHNGTWSNVAGFLEIENGAHSVHSNLQLVVVLTRVYLYPLIEF